MWCSVLVYVSCWFDVWCYITIILYYYTYIILLLYLILYSSSDLYSLLPPPFLFPPIYLLSFSLPFLFPSPPFLSPSISSFLPSSIPLPFFPSSSLLLFTLPSHSFYTCRHLDILIYIIPLFLSQQSDPAQTNGVDGWGV